MIDIAGGAASLHHSDGKKISRRSRARILAALLWGATACLAGCQSPLGMDYSENNTAHYTDSLIARALLDGPNGDSMLITPTRDHGVQEMVRVDNAGPGNMGSATAPTTEAARRAGLSSAQLNMEENQHPLSLHDVIKSAVLHSLAIKVEGFNSAIKETQIVQAIGPFDPVFFAQSQWNSVDEPLVQPGIETNGQTWNNQIGIKQLLVTGAQVQASTTVNYRDATVPFGSVNSLTFKDSYTTNLNLQITQPLLRGFGTNVNEANIYLAQKDQRISLATFRRQVITTVADTEDAYYDLVVAKTNVDILMRLVGASAQTYQVILARIQIDATKANVSQALSALWTREADLLEAQKTYRQASDKLKDLLNDPAISIYDNSLIVPTDKPIAEPIIYSTADCIITALRERTELQEARLQVERTNIVIVVAKNNLLPKVDLVAGIQTNGLDNGFDTAFASQIDPMHSLDFSAGIKFEFSLGNRQFEGEYLQRKLEREQAIDQMMHIALGVVKDVRDNLRELLSRYDEIEVLDSARRAAADEFDALHDLERIQKISPEFLQVELDSQARLAAAEQALTANICNYNRAIMRLEQAKGTLLEFDQISLSKPPIDPHEDDNRTRFLGVTHVNK